MIKLLFSLIGYNNDCTVLSEFLKTGILIAYPKIKETINMVDSLETYSIKYSLSHQTKEMVQALLDGTLTAEQFNSRKYRARKANKISLVLDMSQAYELYMILKKAS